MKPVPHVTWDWFYDNATRRHTHMRVMSDHPDYPVIARWQGNNAHELILRAQQLIREIHSGHKTVQQAYEENFHV